MRWLSTRGVPEAGVGQDGDLCIDQLTGYLYQHKNGAWVCYSRAWHD